MRHEALKISTYFSRASYPELFKNTEPVYCVLDKLEDFLREKAPQVAKTAKIHRLACVVNSVLGDGCFVGEGATIRDSVVGKGVIIGHCCELARSIVLDDANISHFVFVGDSIVGNDVVLGAGVMLANTRLDDGHIKLKVSDQLINTKRRKLGAIIGDGAKIGCCVVANPGVLVGKGVFVTPLTELRGYYPSGVFVSRTQTRKLTK